MLRKLTAYKTSSIRRSAKSPRTLRWLLFGALVLMQTAAGQTTLRGGASVSEPSVTDIYSSQDPLKGKPEVMPPNSRGTCAPPVAGWILVYQTKTTCYYFAPFQVPLQGKVMTPDEAGKYKWERCSAHPWDPKLIICYGNPRPLPGNPGNTPGIYVPGSNPSDGPGLNGRVIATDPCHPNIDMSTPAGRALALQTAAQTKQDCDEFRCLHNPQLPFCKEQFSNKLPANPITDTLDYVRGLTDGMGDCLKGFGDLLVGAGYFAQGDFVNAARAWGLTPGDSVVLKTIAAELNQRIVGVSAYEQGKLAGRRLCAYGMVPGALKGLKNLPGTKANPIRGSVLLDQSTNNPAGLAGKWVQLGNNPPQQFGGYLGGGAFGRVFQLPGSGRVMKLGTSEAGSAESFPRQQQGAQRLKGIVDTPNIYEMDPGGPNNPAHLIMDDVTQRWQGAKQFGPKDLASMADGGTQVLNAVKDMYNKIGGAGYIWPDGHLNNMMFRPNGAGGFVGIIHDADMIMTAPEMQAAFGTSGNIPGSVLRTVLSSKGMLTRLTFPFTSQGAMTTLFRARFGFDLGSGGSTAGGTVPRPAP